MNKGKENMQKNRFRKTKKDPDHAKGLRGRMGVTDKKRDIVQKKVVRHRGRKRWHCWQLEGQLEEGRKNQKEPGRPVLVAEGGTN